MMFGRHPDVSRRLDVVRPSALPILLVSISSYPLLPFALLPFASKLAFRT